MVFSAKCNCNSMLKCKLSRSSKNEEMRALITITLGSSQNCGPNYLRGLKRENFCKDVNTYGSIEQYKSKSCQRKHEKWR